MQRIKFMLIDIKKLLKSVATCSLILACSFLAHSFADDDPNDTEKVFRNESEVGIVMTSGNSNTKSYNFSQLNKYPFGENLIRFKAKYLSTDADFLTTSRYWTIGLRFERELVDRFSVFGGENAEGNIFGGFAQRYSTDVGGKYFLSRRDGFYWEVEAGYRYTIENRITGVVEQSFLRTFSEVNRDWTKTFSTKLNLEILPNLSVKRDYQINTEVSLNSKLHEIFSIKVAYSVRYRNVPPPPATQRNDTQFTTSLVAKI
jgi:putative salt-induced outer membrane protein